MSKAPKKSSGKAPMKSTTDSQGKSGKRKKLTGMGVGYHFRSAIKRIARETNPDHVASLTSQSIHILCSIGNDLIETIADLAGEMARKNGKQTIGSDDIVAALEIILKGELRKLCLREIHTTLAKTQVKPIGK